MHFVIGFRQLNHTDLIVSIYIASYDRFVTMATLVPRILTVDTGSVVQVVLNDQTSNQCVASV